MIIKLWDKIGYKKFRALKQDVELYKNFRNHYGLILLVL